MNNLTQLIRGLIIFTLLFYIFVESILDYKLWKEKTGKSLFRSNLKYIGPLFAIFISFFIVVYLDTYEMVCVHLCFSSLLLTLIFVFRYKERKKEKRRAHIYSWLLQDIREDSLKKRDFLRFTTLFNALILWKYGIKRGAFISSMIISLVISLMINWFYLVLNLPGINTLLDVLLGFIVIFILLNIGLYFAYKKLFKQAVKIYSSDDEGTLY